MCCSQKNEASLYDRYGRFEKGIECYFFCEVLIGYPTGVFYSVMPDDLFFTEKLLNKLVEEGTTGYARRVTGIVRQGPSTCMAGEDGSLTVLHIGPPVWTLGKHEQTFESVLTQRVEELSDRLGYSKKTESGRPTKQLLKVLNEGDNGRAGTSSSCRVARRLASIDQRVLSRLITGHAAGYHLVNVTCHSHTCIGTMTCVRVVYLLRPDDQIDVTFFMIFHAIVDIQNGRVISVDDGDGSIPSPSSIELPESPIISGGLSASQNSGTCSPGYSDPADWQAIAILIPGEIPKIRIWGSCCVPSPYYRAELAFVGPTTPTMLTFQVNVRPIGVHIPQLYAPMPFALKYVQEPYPFINATVASILLPSGQRIRVPISRITHHVELATME